MEQSEARFRAMVEEHSAVMLLIDPLTGRIISTNKAAEQYYGYSLKQLLKMKIHQLNRLSQEQVAQQMQQAVTRQANRFEFQHVLADGKIRDVEVHSAPVTIQNQILLFSVINDISERKRAEEDLREREEKYRLLFNMGVNAMFLVDNNTTQILECNNKASQLFGYSSQELLSMKMTDLSTTPEATRRACQEKVSKIERVYQKKDGGLISVDITSEHFYLGSRSVHVSAIRDITELRKAEAEREKLHAQLNQAQKMESVGRLAGGVAHDFNNMLGVILGHTELALLEADETHELHGDLKEIQKAAKRSADITKQLLAFARKQTISPRQLDLNDTVESMLNMLRRLIGEDIDLAWNPAPHLWPVKMDPSQIDQILANLCVNARDAISGVGKLTIETGRTSFDEDYCKQHAGFTPGDFVLLAVSDNGCGMDKDTLDNIFEPFFTTKEVDKGTGLGLATIYGICKQNSGFINVYSEPGQGSTFKIYLPR
uniref:PAS domain-containing sensor histidine kinase n=1 Tax=Candidatus Electrothrix sp. TaxID=2170559 RepID=UPI004055A82A